MSKDFEDSLFSDLSAGWVVFASCRSNEKSYFLEDKSISVFSYHLIEGLKGNADSDGDSIITLEDINTYVTKKVSQWAIKNNKLQTPNINMEFAGTLTFAINNPEISEPLSMEPEISITERSAQSIVLESEYYSPGSIELYDDYTGEPMGERVVPEAERKEKLLKNKKEFIGYLLGIMINYNYCKPNQIIKENDEYALPFGKIVNTLLNPFKYEFKLIITKDLFTPTITDLFNSLDAQDKLKWKSIEYTFNGNFNFDIVKEIIDEKGYSILEYQLEENFSYLRLTLKTEVKKQNSSTIFLINKQQEAKLKIFHEYGLSREFFQTIPIAGFIDIFSPSIKNVNM